MKNIPREKKLSNLLQYLSSMGARKMSRDGITYYETDEAEKIFEWAVANGMLLHGSPYLFETIEPKKSTDTIRPLGRLVAVYMSRFPHVSMAKTLIGSGTGKYSFYKNGNAIKADVFIDDLSKLNSEGFMYIVDSDDAGDIADNDYVSYKPVRPLAIVRFTKEDFKYPIKVM